MNETYPHYELTNQEKKAYLQRYKAADDEINDLLREKERIMSRLTRMTTSISGMPHGGGESDKMTGGIAKVIELDAEIDCKVDALCDFRHEICAKIGSVGDTTLRRILMLRYISGETWEQIAVEMHYSWRQIVRLHGAALTKIKMS